MSGRFREFVRKSGLAPFVFDDGDAFHQVGDRDHVPVYGEVDGCRRRAVRRHLSERVGRECVDDNLMKLD